MQDKGFMNEKLYQVTMSLARTLLADGAITEQQYADFDTKMRQKYEPKIGPFFADIGLKNACYK